MNAKKNEIGKYLLSDVKSFTVTFSDGLKSKINTSPDNEIVLVKLIPRISKSKHFEDSVLSNYSIAKDMQELADLCGFHSLKTFTRHFKKCFGQTPYQWVLDRKMEEIHSLVIRSNISITEISRIYGFKGVSHLVNAYRRKYGVAPCKDRVARHL